MKAAQSSLVHNELTREGLRVELLPVQEAAILGRASLTPLEECNLCRLGERRQRSWLASRWIIKRLGTHLHPVVPPAFIETIRPGDPRPRCVLPNGLSLPVSVAHDDTWVFGGVCPWGHALGVDVEPVAERTIPVVRRFFPDWPTDAEATTRLWSACEAVIKAGGLGLHEVLGKVEAHQPSAARMVLDAPNGASYDVHQTLFDNRVFSLTTSSRT